MKTAADKSQPTGHVSRRRFLRSAGVALALPWIDSLPVRSAETGKQLTSAAAHQPPVRFACIYFSNGVEPAHWWAKKNGSSMEFGPGLQPMEPHLEDYGLPARLIQRAGRCEQKPAPGKDAQLVIRCLGQSGSE